MDRIFDQVSNFLSRPIGFFTVHVLMLIGFVALSTETFTMVLSVIAISISSFILVSQLKGDLALHLKLDRLIEASDATNDVIAEEQKTLKEIEKDKGAC